MMNSPKFSPLRLGLFGLAVILLWSCQNTEMEDDLNILDEDMITATNISDEYFAELEISDEPEARRKAKWLKSRRNITVLKYRRGKNGDAPQLVYRSNRGDKGKYLPINEETVTSILEPGEIVFWYAGAGVKILNEIDFDDESEAALTDLPAQWKRSNMWFLKIPEEIDLETLKYDIVYTLKGVDDPIRLDPKLQIDK